MTTNSDLEKIAAEYHLVYQEDMFIENICQEYELEWLKSVINYGSKVLELGFGDGVTFRSLFDYCDLSVVEGSRLMLEKAHSVAGDLGAQSRIIHSLFEEYEPKEKFDFVFASHVLEHVDDPELLMKRMKSWLNPQGKLVIVVPNAESIHRRLALNLGLQPTLDSLSKRDLLVGHQRVFKLDDLLALCDSTGWNVVKTEGFFLKPLSNSQLKIYDNKLIRALCEVSKELPPEFCANLALVISNKEGDVASGI